MLVLTRRLDESLVIDENIIITILAIEGEKVKIGISAPLEVSVLRKELLDAYKAQELIAEQLAASQETVNFAELREFLASQYTADNSSKE